MRVVVTQPNQMMDIAIGCHIGLGHIEIVWQSTTTEAFYPNHDIDSVTKWTDK